MSEPVKEIDRAAFAKWEEGALLFLRAGGSLSLTEFMSLPPAQQAAAAKAGDMLRFSTASLVGFASRGQQEALAVLSLAEGTKASPPINLVAGTRAMLREFKVSSKGGV